MTDRYDDSPASYVRSPELLTVGQSQLLVIDVQEKLLPLIVNADQLVLNCEKLLRAAEILAVPHYATEQYPGGLGKTIDSLAPLIKQPVPEKLRFSSAEALVLQTNFTRQNRNQVVVCGMETHVCVLQTTYDLLAMGYRVTVVADAVSSRKKSDWQFGLQRLADTGATITTTEAVLFEWCEVAGTDAFKQISKFVK